MREKVLGPLLGDKYQVTIKIFSHFPGIQGGSCMVPGRALEFLFEISQLCQWHLFSQLHNFPKHLINYTNRKERDKFMKYHLNYFYQFHQKFKISWNANRVFPNDVPNASTIFLLFHTNFFLYLWASIIVNIKKVLFLSVKKQYSPVLPHYLLDTSTITLAQTVPKCPLHR